MSDQRSDKKAVPGICFYFRLNVEPKILDCEVLSSVLSHTTDTLPDESYLQQQVAVLY